LASAGIEVIGSSCGRVATTTASFAHSEEVAEHRRHRLVGREDRREADVSARRSNRAVARPHSIYAVGVSAAAANAARFYREVARTGRLWTIRDAGGYPAPLGSDGVRAQPFWSSQKRAARIVERIPAYAGFNVVPIEWVDFVERWVPGLARDGILVGVNWTGPRATGFDVAPADVASNVAAVREILG
jgi:hypothetical protein